MNKFAKLETHDGAQVLSYVDTDDEGAPCVVFVMDLRVLVKAMVSYDDTDAGWDAAYDCVRTQDLYMISEELRALEAGLMGEVS